MMRNMWYSILKRLTSPACQSASLLLVILLFTAARGYPQVTFLSTQMTLPTGTLNSPSGVATDALGDIFIAGPGNQGVIMLPATPTGLGAPVTLVQGLVSPGALAIDQSGDLLITDSGAGAVLMLPSGAQGYGPLVTVATQLNSPSGIAVDSVSDIAVADTGNNRIQYFSRSGAGYSAPITLASGLNTPTGLAFDQNGNLYIAEATNNDILLMTRTVNGYSAPTAVIRNLVAPTALALDLNNDLFISQAGNASLLQCLWSTSASHLASCTTLATGFQTPAGLAVDAAGNAYLADSAAGTVTKVTSQSMAFGSIPENVASQAQTFNFQVAAGTSIGAIQIANPTSQAPEFADAGTSTCVAQTYPSQTYCGVALTFTPNASGARNGAIQLSSPTGSALVSVYISGFGQGSQPIYLGGTPTILATGLNSPTGVAADGNGNIFIADTGNDRIVELQSSGVPSQQTIIPVSGVLSPTGIAVDVLGNLFITSSGNDRVLKVPFTPTGYGPAIRMPGGYDVPSGVGLDSTGNLFIANTYSNLITKLLWNGTGYALPQSVEDGFPVGIALDASAHFYSVSPYSSGIVRMSTTFVAFQPSYRFFLLPNVTLSQPTGIAVDGNNNLYILDAGKNSVSLLLWNGTGYNRPIVVASGFNDPGGLAIDGRGNLYVADTGNNQIVQVSLFTPPALTFAGTYIGTSSSDSPRATTIVNTGNLPVSLSDLQFPPDFPKGPAITTSCAEALQLNPGDKCQMTVSFLPENIGTPLTETVSVTETSPGSPAIQKSFHVTGNSTGTVAQSLSFPNLPNIPYGTITVAVSASATSGLPARIQVVSGPAILTSGGSQLRITGAGTVILQATQQGNAEYTPAQPVTQSFLVYPATLTVTPMGATAVYGSLPETYKYGITGFVAGDNAASSITGQASITTSASSTSGVGTYSIIASAGSLSAANYTFSFAASTLTLLPATLQVKAAASTSIYGSPLPTLVYTISGFVNGEDSTALTGNPCLTTSATAASPVGSYAISATQGSLASSNYKFLFVNSVLTIAPAQLTITALSKSSVYGQTLPLLTFSVIGLVNGDSQQSAVSGAPSLSTTATTRSIPGQYPISVSKGTLKAINYTLAFSGSTLTMQKAMLTVTPQTATGTYGGALPPLGYQITGFVPGDIPSLTVSGSPLLTTLATMGSPVGSYPVTATQGSLQSALYTFTFSISQLVIAPAPLTVTPQSLSVVYGQNPPAFTYALSGFVNGDSVRVVAGAPAFNTQVNQFSWIGDYRLTVSLGTLSSPNYSFRFTGATVTVTRATLTVTAGTLASTYGSPLGAFPYQITGLVNGDTLSVISGGPAFQPGATSQSPVGSYSLGVSAGRLYARNYNFQFVSGSILVTPATLTITPHNQKMAYGSATPPLTYSVTGFKLGESSSVLSGTPLCSTPASAQSPVGDYPIACSSGSLATPNYIFAFAGGTLSVRPAQLTVTATDQSSIYGASLPALSYTIAGFVNGDTHAAVTGAPQLSTTVLTGSPVGTYSITAARGSLAATNYSFVFKPGKLTINGAPLTITANNLTMVHGAAVPALTFSASGFIKGETLASASSGSPNLLTPATSASADGSYPIWLLRGTFSASNYKVTYISGTIKVDK